jgi:hypothetical protein
MVSWCPGGPLPPLCEVADRVAADRVKRHVGDTAESPAREAVYHFLLERYPCDGE